MSKTILIVSGGVEAVPGIRRAKELGLHVIVSDRNPEAPGFEFADDQIIADTYGVEETAKAAERYHRESRPIDGVICVAADVPLTVAAVAEKLGLPSISMETARLASDKILMKNRFARDKLPIPWYSGVDNPDQLAAIVERRGYPLIIKPVDSRGARGVLRLTPGIDLRWAFSVSKNQSPTGRVMVEEYLDGPQISTESIVIDGRFFTPGFTDRNYEFLEKFKPYVIENGGQQPSKLKQSERSGIIDLVEWAGRSLGVENGVVKGDMVLTAKGPKIIEIATRLSGGWFSSSQIPLATGVDFLGAALKRAVGLSVNTEELVPRFKKGVAIRYFFPPPGSVIKICNTEQFLKKPWVHRLSVFIGPGSAVEPVTDHTKRAGFVITTGKTRAQAVQRAELVCSTVTIKTRLP